MVPAAVLSILVKAQGMQATASQLKALDTAGRRTATGLRSTEDGAKRTGSTLAKLGSVAKTAGGLAGVGGLAVGVHAMVSEYREAQKTAAQTNAVLKSTGGAANVSARDVAKLAGAISKKTGIDDEAIQSSENMLLTFTNVRNELGKGNKIFDQATQVVTDMSVALGQSGKSSAIQLGKALQDPIKGVTALQRVGVKLTDQQKAQITTLVEHGRALDAQKVILRELNKEFGGSAAAQATAGDKLKVSLGNLAEAAGGVLVPMLDKVAKFMTTVIDQFIAGEGIARFIIPAFQAIGTAISVLIDWFKALIGGIGTLITGFKEGNTWAVVIGTTVIALTAAFVAYEAITRTTAGTLALLAKAQAAVDFAMKMTPWVRVVTVLVALGTAIYVAYQKSQDFRDAVASVGDALASIPGAVTRVAHAIGGAFSAIPRTIGNVAVAIANAFGTAIKFMMGLPARITTTAYNVGVSIINGVLKGLSGLASAVVTTIENSLVAALTSLNPFSPVEHGGEQYIGRPLAEGTLKGWVDGSTELPTTMSETVRNAVQRAKDTLDAMRGDFSDAWSRLSGDALSAFDAIQGQKKTPTEKLLAQQLDAREVNKLASDVADANQKLAEAQATGTQTDVVAAQKALDDARWAQIQHDLEKRAQGERKELDAQTALRRRHFEDQLDTLKTSLEKSGATQVVAHKKVMALFKKFGVDYRLAGAASGQAFATGMKESETTVDKSSADIAGFLSKNLTISQADVVKAAETTGKKAAEAAKKGAKSVKPGKVSLPEAVAAVPAPSTLPQVPKIPKLPTQADIKPLKLEIDTSKFTQPLMDARNAFQSFIDWLKQNGPLLVEVLRGPFALVSDIMGRLASGAVTTFIAGFTAAGPALLAAGNWIVTQVTAGIEAAPGALVGAAQWLLSTFIGAIKAAPGVLASGAQWLISSLTAGIRAQVAALVAVGGWAVRRIVDGIHAVAAVVVAVGGWIKNRLTEGLTAAVAGILAAGVWLVNRFVEGIKTNAAAMLTVGGWIKNRLTDGLTAVVSGITTAGGWVTNRIVDGMKAAGANVMTVGTWLKNRLVEAFDTVKDAFKGMGSSIIGWIVDGLKGGLKLVVDFANDIIGVLNTLLGVIGVDKIKPIKLAEGGQNAAGGKDKFGPNFAHGGAFARTGGYVNSPITLMGEEAPRHPEYVIPTNPAYRKRAQGLLGSAAGAIGMQAGGVWSKSALMGLWDRVNPGLGNANLMAAIALAESGGNQNARNPSGASGLWQILGVPFPGDPFDPTTNARMAGSKLRSQGLGAWEVYTTGAYKHFLGGGDSGAGKGVLGAVGKAVSGALDAIGGGAEALLGKLPGVGDLPDWMKGTGKWVLDKVGSWIKDKVSGLLSVGGGGGATVKAINGRLQLPMIPRATHETAGLAGYPAEDVFAPPGTRVLAPSSGLIDRLSGQAGGPGGGGPFGYSIYLTGGPGRYFMTHFGRTDVSAGQHVARGDQIGLVADYPGGVPDHIHEGLHRMAKGGKYGPYMGSYKTGGVLPGDGLYYGHKGETVIPMAIGGAFAPSWYKPPPFDVRQTLAFPGRQVTPGYTPPAAVAAAVPVEPSYSQSDIDALTGQIDGLNGQISDLNGQIATLNATIGALQATIDNLNAQLELQRIALAEAQRKYNTSQTQYATLAKAIADVASGELGGRVGLGYMSPSFAGGGVRY